MVTDIRTSPVDFWWMPGLTHQADDVVCPLYLQDIQRFELPNKCAFLFYDTWWLEISKVQMENTVMQGDLHKTREVSVQGCKYIQNGSSKLHLDFLINWQKERNMYKERLDSVLLCEPERMIVDIVAYKSTSIIRRHNIISQLGQAMDNFINRKRSLQLSRKRKPSYS